MEPPKRLLFIQQAYFLPWMGYFAKAAQSDVVVLLTDCPYRRNHLSRAGYLSQFGQPKWLSLPVGASQGQRLNSISLPTDRKFIDSWTDRISEAYGKSSHFHSVSDVWKRVIGLVGDREITNVAALNVEIFETLFRYIFPELRPSIVCSTAFSWSDDRNIRTLEALRDTRCHILVIGDGGAAAVHDLDGFRLHGYEIARVPFFTKHPTYVQISGGNVFYPGLSVLDSLFNVGRMATRELILSVEATMI